MAPVFFELGRVRTDPGTAPARGLSQSQAFGGGRSNGGERSRFPRTTWVGPDPWPGIGRTHRQGIQPMLKITVEGYVRRSKEDSTPTRTLKLEGKLIGPWVEELERVWNAVTSEQAAKHVVVDLCDVLFV